MNVEYRKKSTEFQQLNIAKLSNLVQNPFQNIMHLFGNEFFFLDDTKNFKRSYLKN